MANQQQLFSFMQPSDRNPTVLPEKASSSGNRSSGDKRSPERIQSSSKVVSRTKSASSRDGCFPGGATSQVNSPNQVNSPSQVKSTSRDDVLKALRTKVGCVTTARQDGHPTFSTGCQAIDSWLPSNGLHPASLTEWIAAHDGTAAGSLAFVAAAKRLHQVPARPLVIVDCQGTFYPPAAVSLGVPSERMILVRPRSGSDCLWAIDQSLRSGAVAAVWANLPMRLDDTQARRLQLAAETGSTPGLFVRDFAARGKPSFAEVQFYISKQSANVQRSEVQRPETEVISVTLDRVRGGIVGQHVAVRIDDSANIYPVHSISASTSDVTRHQTAAGYLASQLANPTTARRKQPARYAS